MELHRSPSFVSVLNGGSNSAELATREIAAVASRVRAVLRRYPKASIGLCGVSEGLVILDDAMQPLHAFGNGPIERVDLRARVNSEGCAVSLQGFLAFALTGQLRSTASEVEAMSNVPNSPVFRRAGDGRISFAKRARVGEAIGVVDDNPHRPVFLGGTDEHAACFGAALGESTDFLLNAASYWGILAAPAHPNAAVPADVRVVAADPPYPMYFARVGYRWGVLLWQIKKGMGIKLDADPPDWVWGSFVRRVMADNGPSQLDDAFALVSADLEDTFARLSKVVSNSATPRTTLAGGGLATFDRRIRDMVPPNHKVQRLSIDASLLGLAKLARLAG